MLNARIRKRWRTGQLKVGVIGARVDLTYPYDYLGAGTGFAWRTCAAAKAPSPSAEEREAADHAGRQGATARPDGAAILALAAKLAAEVGAVATAGTALPSCTQRRRGSARSISASCRARAGSNAAQMTTSGTLDVLFLLGADEIKRAGRRLRRLHRHAWRRGRAPRRRDPAGRGLHREVRRSTSTPRAACRWPAARRSRRARRARIGRSSARCPTSSARSCPSTRRHALRQAIFKAAPHLMRVDQIEAGNAADIKTLAGKGGSVEKDAVQVVGARISI